MATKIYIALIFGFFIHCASADQASIISIEESEAVLELLEGQNEFWKYCAPCSSVPPELMTVETIEVEPFTNSSDELKARMNLGDLAYRYYRDGDSWRNIAIAAGIKTFEVPEYINPEELIAEMTEPGYIDNRDQVEAVYTNCKSENGLTTAAMNYCTNLEAEAWDTELNRVYQELMNNHLTEEGQTTLRAAQRKWIEQRDLEIEFIDAMFSRREFWGTSWSSVQLNNKLTITKNRVNDLYRYLSIHNF